ncbi:MAG: hypothetical protein QXD76_01215 [Sulfolobales archaeon]
MFMSGRVLEVQRLSEGFFRILIKLLDKPLHRPAPFQFMMIWVPRKDLMPMSVSDYDKDLLSIVFKIRGEGTRELSRNPGFVGVNGFYGRGFKFSSKNPRILFVAGGSGIAPLPYLARDASEIDGEITVIWGVRRRSELFNLEKLASYRSIRRIYYAAEDYGSEYVYRGTALDLYRELYQEDEWDLIIGSGPREMLKKLCLNSRSRERIYLNLEAYMKCGIGFCGSCVLKPKPLRLCVEGPLIRCDEVVEHLEQEG